MKLIQLAERGYLPDWLIRIGIRRLLAERLRQNKTYGSLSSHLPKFAEMLSQSPIAVATDAANEQHYEVPAEFYQAVLGPRLKYSCCHYKSASTSLADAEFDMLSITCERAGIRDGMKVLELGCGWGSLTLWMAEQYPNASITAVSNSSSQREFIQQRASSRGLQNVNVITCDMREFQTDLKFDRIVSIEMFEHMRNYQELLHRVANWLADDGELFVHIFCHKDTPYLFETDGEKNWMGRHFFTGGTMPSEHLFQQFDHDLSVKEQWRVNGMHYWQTCEDWLKELDRNLGHLTALLSPNLGRSETAVYLQRWRIFFMACAELFRYDGGNEWFVAHYRFCLQPNRVSTSPRATVNSGV